MECKGEGLGVAGGDLWLIVMGEEQIIAGHSHGPGGGDAGYWVTSCLMDSFVLKGKERRRGKW